MVGVVESISGRGGMLTLVIKHDDGTKKTIHVDNGPFVRACASMYPEEQVILPGHRFNDDAIVGKRIEYTVTDWSDSVMAGFEPA